jgi:hypothetical protein
MYPLARTASAAIIHMNNHTHQQQTSSQIHHSGHHPQQIGDGFMPTANQEVHG